MRIAFSVAGLSVALAGCVPATQVKEGGDVRAAAVPKPPALPDRECVPSYYRFAFLATDTKVYRQGQIVKLTPTLDTSPAGTHVLPLRCVSDWVVTGPATLSADRTAVTIAPDAAVGSIVRISFRHEGEPVVAELKVIGRDAIVLTGLYSQKAVANCQATDPVRELEFTPGDHFSVTFYPFETYRDYWGTYTFDPATKRIAMKVEGGNFVPPSLDLEGEVDFSAGRLVLKGVFLGARSSEPQADCTYTF
jgi:hypothetical protein